MGFAVVQWYIPRRIKNGRPGIYPRHERKHGTKIIKSRTCKKAETKEAGKVQREGERRDVGAGLGRGLKRRGRWREYGNDLGWEEMEVAKGRDRTLEDEMDGRRK